MCSDASSAPADEESHRSSALDAARTNLVRTLEQMRSFESRTAFDAISLMVDALVARGFTPEASVIEVKRAIERSACLARFEQPTRERVRAAMVACCIDRYFEARESLGMRAPPYTGRTLPGPREADGSV